MRTISNTLVQFLLSMQHFTISKSVVQTQITRIIQIYSIHRVYIYIYISIITESHVSFEIISWQKKLRNCFCETAWKFVRGVINKAEGHSFCCYILKPPSAKHRIVCNSNNSVSGSLVYLYFPTNISHAHQQAKWRRLPGEVLKIWIYTHFFWQHFLYLKQNIVYKIIYSHNYDGNNFFVVFYCFTS